MSEEFRAEIDAVILSGNAYVVAVGDVAECPHCAAEGNEIPFYQRKDYLSRTYTRVSDGYVHSVGFHGAGYPEIFVLVGPTNATGDKVLSAKQLIERMAAATDLINYFYENKETHTPDPDEYLSSSNNDQLYWTMLTSSQGEDNSKIKEIIDNQLLKTAEWYYGHKKFETIIYVPYFRAV